jgi:hypothetical protein
MGKSMNNRGIHSPGTCLGGGRGINSTKHTKQYDHQHNNYTQEKSRIIKRMKNRLTGHNHQNTNPKAQQHQTIRDTITTKRITQIRSTHKAGEHEKENEEIKKIKNELIINQKILNIKGLKKIRKNKNLSTAIHYKSENNHYQTHELYKLK